MPATLLIATGLFQDRDGVVVHPPTGELIQLEAALEPLIGAHVELALHHFPPNAKIDPSEPGGGCCMLAQHCAVGHVRDPAWLYSVRAAGVLSHEGPGTWRVGDTVVPLLLQMPGHYGRLILFSPGAPSESSDVSGLAAEAESLVGLLTSLRNTLKASS